MHVTPKPLIYKSREEAFEGHVYLNFKRCLPSLKEYKINIKEICTTTLILKYQYPGSMEHVT